MQSRAFAMRMKRIEGGRTRPRDARRSLVNLLALELADGDALAVLVDAAKVA